MATLSREVLPRELAQLELTDDALTVATYRALAQRQHALGPVAFDAALRLVVYLHVQNNDHPFDLEYELAVVDVVLRALRWYAYDVQQAFAALDSTWLLHYQIYAHTRNPVFPRNIMRHALTKAYSR